MSAEAKGREAVERMAKNIKEHNEAAGIKEGEGESFQRAGTSYDAARKYAETRAYIAEQKVK